MGENEQHDLYY